MALTETQSISLEEYRKLLKLNECRRCHFEGLLQEVISHYPHSGGWKVQGFDKPQWLFIVCPKCKYQWALWKLGVSR